LQHYNRNIFDKNIRISCLGYSIGGLAALSIFLDNPKKYNAWQDAASGSGGKKSHASH
jgi:hypothetical protein